MIVRGVRTTCRSNRMKGGERVTVFRWNYLRGGGGSGVTLRERGLKLIVIVESIGFRAAVAPEEAEGRPAESKHGPIDAQINAVFRSGHSFDWSLPSELPEGVEAIDVMSPIDMPGVIVPSSQRPKAVASPGIRVTVDSARSRSARNRRIV